MLTNIGIELFESYGRLCYSQTENAGVKLIVEVDPGISQLYRWLIPKYVKLNPQKYAPHISVVRHETPVKIENWGLHEGEIIPFQYSGVLHHGTVYWWLNAYSKRLEEIRLELGLPVDSPYTRPPDGLEKTFHITLGNNKPLIIG